MVNPNVRRTFETLVAAAFVDGQLAAEERAVLQRKATELDIPIRLFDEILDRGRKGNLSLALPANQDQQFQLLDDMIDVVCSDGRLERAENRLLLRLATHVNLDPQALGRRVQERMERLKNKPRTIARKQIPEPEVVVIRDEKPKRVAPPPPSPEPPRYEAPEPPPPAYEAFPTPPPGSAIGDESAMSTYRPGPVALGRSLDSIEEIPPVTQGLVRSVILFEGVEAAVRYLTEKCGAEDPTRARLIIDRILAADPTLKPAK